MTRIAVNGVCALLLGITFVASAKAGKIEFGLAELPGREEHGDSFVVAIDESETELIAHARALIAWVRAGADPETSPGGTILTADIVAGPDGINRNYLAPGEPLWSWHVVGTPFFADNTIEILDGWPSFVEQDVAGWIDNTDGAIGFWNYTVVSELGEVVPEPSTWALLFFATAACAAGKWHRRMCRGKESPAAI